MITRWKQILTEKLVMLQHISSTLVTKVHNGKISYETMISNVGTFTSEFILYVSSVYDHELWSF